MGSYVQVLYHIVFATHRREPVLTKERRPDLYRYIWGILKKKNCHTYRIGGVADHVHLAVSLHPAIALADLVKDIKVSSNLWIGEQEIFPSFAGWQEGYAAFSFSHSDKESVIAYIRNQESHHQVQTLAEEWEALIGEGGMQIRAADEEVRPLRGR